MDKGGKRSAPAPHGAKNAETMFMDNSFTLTVNKPSAVRH